MCLAIGSEVRTVEALVNIHPESDEEKRNARIGGVLIVVGILAIAILAGVLSDLQLADKIEHFFNSLF